MSQILLISWYLYKTLNMSTYVAIFVAIHEAPLWPEVVMSYTRGWISHFKIRSFLLKPSVLLWTKLIYWEPGIFLFRLGWCLALKASSHSRIQIGWYNRSRAPRCTFTGPTLQNNPTTPRQHWSTLTIIYFSRCF